MVSRLAFGNFRLFFTISFNIAASIDIFRASSSCTIAILLSLAESPAASSAFCTSTICCASPKSGFNATKLPLFSCTWKVMLCPNCTCAPCARRAKRFSPFGRLRITWLSFMLFTTPVTVSPASKDARYFALMVFTCSVCPAFSAAALSVDALSELFVPETICCKKPEMWNAISLYPFSI